MNLEKIIKKGSEELKRNKISSHGLDAEIILSDIMGITREFLITNNNINISDIIKKEFYNNLDVFVLPGFVDPV